MNPIISTIIFGAPVVGDAAGGGGGPGAGVDNLLLETADILLLETGDKLLLE